LASDVSHSGLARYLILLILGVPVLAAGQRDRIRAALFVPENLPAVDAESYGEADIAPGVVAERVSYATDYGLRVPAIVYRPALRPAGKLPGMMVVNGHGGDKYTWYAFYAGVLYARAGAVVLTYDPIGEGERNLERKDGTRQHDRNVTPEEMGRPYFVTRPVAVWLGKQLNLSAPFAAMPETHVSEWAAANHVPIDKQYATELREGGTMALGAGVPGVPHDLLDALPRGKWEAGKGKYVYETWLREAGRRTEANRH